MAILFPSAGPPSHFPHNLRRRARGAARAPRTAALARDPHAAFRDEEVKAVIVSIGGDDSVRLLPHLDADVFASNPKVLMGYVG